MVKIGVTIVCAGRSTLQYLRLISLGPELVIGGHITLDGNHWAICDSDVGFVAAVTCGILNRLKG